MLDNRLNVKTEVLTRSKTALAGVDYDVYVTPPPSSIELATFVEVETFIIERIIEKIL